MHRESRDLQELEAAELEGVSGGGIIDSIVNAWNSFWTPKVNHPVEDCPQCYAGGGGGARG